ncbi:hypothetical protein HNY73_005166 [Argiope bruennichi]|uniref:Uncharacterized protein n=1 Tax=Argiope bruennichi TaxID=94029 RepID=A0A8T0FGJ1_ARGBR|nr:hypothetical protein HNY73_005166 [Argiope bruennichi]
MYPLSSLKAEHHGVSRLTYAFRSRRAPTPARAIGTKTTSFRFRLRTRRQAPKVCIIWPLFSAPGSELAVFRSCGQLAIASQFRRPAICLVVPVYRLLVLKPKSFLLSTQRTIQLSKSRDTFDIMRTPSIQIGLPAYFSPTPGR